MNGYLLDTHAILWWLDDPTQLSAEAREAIADANSLVYVSAAVVWEMAIKKSLGRRRNGYLFIADGHSPDPERPLTSRMIRSIINAVAHRAGLGHLNPHALRHSFGTHLVDRGADVMYVKELLRHESVRTTQIYLHTSTAQVRRVYDRCFPRA